MAGGCGLRRLLSAGGDGRTAVFENQRRSLHHIGSAAAGCARLSAYSGSADVMTAVKPAVAGVIGWPVAHSKSPLIHRFWLDKLNIEIGRASCRERVCQYG